MQSGVLVLGVGNTLLSDEGVGVHALNHLAAEDEHTPPAASIQYLDGGTLSFVLAAAIEDTNHLIIIDATELGAAAGTVQTYEGRAMDDYLGSNRKHSVHEVSLLDLLAVVHLTGKLPEKRALVGIQPERVDWGHTPSESVAAAIPAACKAVRSLIQRWQT